MAVANGPMRYAAGHAPDESQRLGRIKPLQGYHSCVLHPMTELLLDMATILKPRCLWRIVWKSIVSFVTLVEWYSPFA